MKNVRVLLCVLSLAFVSSGATNPFCLGDDHGTVKVHVDKITLSSIAMLGEGVEVVPGVVPVSGFEGEGVYNEYLFGIEDGDNFGFKFSLPPGDYYVAALLMSDGIVRAVCSLERIDVGAESMHDINMKAYLHVSDIEFGILDIKEQIIDKIGPEFNYNDYTLFVDSRMSTDGHMERRSVGRVSSDLASFSIRAICWNPGKYEFNIRIVPNKNFRGARSTEYTTKAYLHLADASLRNAGFRVNVVPSDFVRISEKFRFELEK
jgi:hypothetical protein